MRREKIYAAVFLFGVIAFVLLVVNVSPLRKLVFHDEQPTASNQCNMTPGPNVCRSIQHMIGKSRTWTAKSTEVLAMEGEMTITPPLNEVQDYFISSIGNNPIASVAIANDGTRTCQIGDTYKDWVIVPGSCLLQGRAVSNGTTGWTDFRLEITKGELHAEFDLTTN